MDRLLSTSTDSGSLTFPIPDTEMDEGDPLRMRQCGVPGGVCIKLPKPGRWTALIEFLEVFPDINELLLVTVDSIPLSDHFISLGDDTVTWKR